ncbi:hypothetical protein A45J_2692 [hot springs metagenome]|uniref:Uncharacterized protein n=1 Tax=hot springs metagenome TaxID=433727 RepID=A0A5J4KRE4_9ZZZZ
MKITIPEVDEYGDVLEVLEDLPKAVRIKIVAQAIREYKESVKGGAIINLLRKQKSKPAESKKPGKEKASTDRDPLKKVMGGFL